MRSSAVLLAWVVLTTAVHSAHSCTCIPEAGSTHHKVVAADRDAAFVGIVRISAIRYATATHDSNGRYVGLRDAAAPSKYAPAPGDWPYMVASFQPIHVWKGRDVAGTDVATGVGMAACGLPLKAGQVVLLYAYAPNYTGLMQADACGRTNLADHAVEDINILSRRYGSRPPPNNRWRGP
jgi:hypothetical protein